MIPLIQLVESEKISVITLKSILDSVHTCESSTPKAPEVVRLISTRIEDEARATYYKNIAAEEVLQLRNTKLIQNYLIQALKEKEQKLLLRRN